MIASFNRSVLGQFMTNAQLDELDKRYEHAKEKRKLDRKKWRLNPCPCCGSREKITDEKI